MQNENSIYFSIELLNEAIHLKNDKISMFNLASIYFYGFRIETNFDKSIELLINSKKNHFFIANELLSLVLIKKYGNVSLTQIELEIQKYSKSDTILATNLYRYIRMNQLFDNKNYQFHYDYCKKIEYYYNVDKNPILLTEKDQKKSEGINKDNQDGDKNSNYNINNEFYLGFS